MQTSNTTFSTSVTQAALRRTATYIAPLWSLESFVAVNPYLGMAQKRFAEAMDFLHKSGKVKATLPIAFYLQALQQGRMSREHIAEALAHNDHGLKVDADALINELLQVEPAAAEDSIQTFSDLASEINGKRWGRFLADRISFWASAYFDRHQAIWKTSVQQPSLFAAWKKEAEVDLSAEVMGLKGFRKFIRSLPNDHLQAASYALSRLDLPENTVDHYLTRLTLNMNGWAGVAARIDWDAGLTGAPSQAVEEFMAILLSWEIALQELLPYPDLEDRWRELKERNQRVVVQSGLERQLALQLVLQDAFDRANQAAILQKINNQPKREERTVTPKAQAVFCIDVRSELFRRKLEAADPAIETLGFAGFFAFPIQYQPLAYAQGSAQCPVLLRPSHTIKESLGNEQEDRAIVEKRTLQEHVF